MSVGKDKKSQIPKKSSFNYGIKFCLTFLFLSTLYTSKTFSMLLEESSFSDDCAHYAVKVKKSEIPHVELLVFAGITDEEEKDQLYAFIQKYLVQHESIAESNLKKILRFSGQSIGAVLGSLAGIPYFEVGRKAGGQNEIIAWGTAGATTLTVSGTGAWSYFNLLKELDPQSLEEKNLLPKSKLVIPTHVVSHALGLISAVPTAYLAARFNTHKWLAVISYGLEYSLKTNGFLTLFSNVLPKETQSQQSLLAKNQTSKELSFLEIQPLLVNHLLKKTIPSIIAMQNEERNELLSLLYQEGNLTVENYLNSLLSLSTASQPLEEGPETWKRGYPRTAFVGVLSVSALINVVHNFHCAYEAWRMLYDYPPFIVPMAVLSVVPTFILELHATVKTGHAFYDSVFHRIAGTSSPTLAQSLYPKFMKALPVVCLSLAGVTAYVGRYMVLDVLQDVFPREYSLFFSIGGALGPLLFASYANYSVVQDVVLSYTRSYGEDHQKKLALLVQDVEKLTQVMSLTKPEEMQKFLSNRSIQNVLPTLNKQEATEATPLIKKSRSKCGIM